MKRKSELKKAMIFILVCIACGVVGVLFGRFAGKNEDSIVEMFQDIKSGLQKALPVLYAAVFVILTAVSFLFYGRVKKLERSLDGSDDDDEKLDKIEEIINYPILVSNLLLIASIFLYASCMDTALFTTFGKANDGLYFVFPTILFFASFVCVIAVQRMSIEMEKRQNTEKSASVFDFNFNSKWLEESDEAEKIKAYKAGFDGFRAMNLTCVILWLVSLVASLVLKTGVFPIFIICVIWGVGVTVSAISGTKQEKHGMTERGSWS